MRFSPRSSARHWTGSLPLCDSGYRFRPFGKGHDLDGYRNVLFQDIGSQLDLLVGGARTNTAVSPLRNSPTTKRDAMPFS
jgi:hypothetical protein